MRYIYLFFILLSLLKAEDISTAQIVVETAEVKDVPVLTHEEVIEAKVEAITPIEEDVKEELTEEEKKEEQKIEEVKDDASSELIEIKDTSGLSEEEVVKVAEKIDEQKVTKNVSVQEVFDAVDEKGDIDIKKLQQPWEDLSPKTDGFDWIKTKSGEWFKGEIKAMYDDNLEFDSDEVGLYTFDFEDIKQIKSHRSMTVNIEDVASFSGVLRFKEDTVTIIQGDKQYMFPRSQIVSLAPTAEEEFNNWTGKISISLDGRRGNKNQVDYVATVNIKRRTDRTRLYLDYLGRISKVEDEDGTRRNTANDHRVNEKFDIYLTRRFFWTPIFTEYYTDEFQNIDYQVTAGVGLGYTFYDTSKLYWSVSSGPGLIKTKYENVPHNEDDSDLSPALEFSTKFEYELNSISDIKYDYKGTFTDKKSGSYKHHMVLKLENDLTSWIDLDITAIWDRIAHPEKNEDGTSPDSDDYQLLIGFGIEF